MAYSKVERNLVEVLREGYQIKEVRDEFRKRMDTVAFLRMQNMINKTVPREEFADYYLSGYAQFEFVEMTGLTKQRVAVIIGGQYKDKYTREEALAIYRENRKKLVDVANWYVGVYKVDMEGDLELVLDCVSAPSNLNTLSILYDMYKELGGTKLELKYDEVDLRYWTPEREENEKEREAVQMYLAGEKGRKIREKLNLDAETLFRCYKRASRKKEYDKKYGQGTRKEYEKK
ncbi:hypothetical protein [Bacillus cereus]|uniref:hypothetical protein n=1 Tax=Bacillus cereus TaxID=1396 RepID=UPI000BFCDF6D|nr:hypothetical protein [Bacillus cereus]PGR83686.1 hypothetical protein COC63_06780 [Bacillus cereus]